MNVGPTAGKSFLIITIARVYGQVAKKRSRSIKRCWNVPDIAFPTLDDEDALWGQQPVEEVIARTHAAGVQEVVVKRGRRTLARSRIQGEALIDVPAVKLPKEKVIGHHCRRRPSAPVIWAVRLTGRQRRMPARSADT